MVKTLITCTSPRCDDYVSDLNNRNIDAIASPALSVHHIDTPKPNGDFDAVLVTSRHIDKNEFHGLPLITLDMGYGGIHDLDLSEYKNILYPCAVEPTYIPKNCTPWPVYETTENTEFTVGDSKIICVFSIKAAKIISTHNIADKIILCLSKQIAEIFENTPIQKLAVCTCPRYDDMISLITQQIEAHT